MSAADIIKQVCMEHLVTKEEFFGRIRTELFVAARKEAAERLFKLDYTPNKIGRLLHRDHATVRNYLSEGYRERARARYFAKRVLGLIDTQAKDAVLEAAKREETAPELIIAKWVNERVQSEARASA